MDEHSQLRELMGSYLAYGAPAEPLFAAHLSQCELCQTELVHLKDVTGVLQASVDDYAQNVEWNDEAQRRRLGAALGDQVLRLRLRRWRIGAVGAGVAAAAMAVFAVSTSGTSPSVPIIPKASGVNLSMVSSGTNLSGSVGASGKAFAQYRGWGSQIVIDVKGLAPKVSYNVIVYSGTKQQLVGTWYGTGATNVQVEVASSFQAAHITRISIVTSYGTNVLTSV